MVGTSRHMLLLRSRLHLPAAGDDGGKLLQTMLCMRSVPAVGGAAGAECIFGRGLKIFSANIHISSCSHDLQANPLTLAAVGGWTLTKALSQRHLACMPPLSVSSRRLVLPDSILNPGRAVTLPLT